LSTAPAAEQQKTTPRPKTRIARILLPQIDANSALLPPDKWILRTAFDFIKGNKSLHDTIIRTAAYAGAGLTAVVAGVVGAVVLFPLALPMAAVGLAAVGAAAFSGFRAKFHFERFKKETLPELRNEVGKKYLDYKMSELKAAWQRNLDERRKKKAEAKTNAAPKEEKKAEAPQPEVKKEPAPAATNDKTAVAEKAPEKKPAEKKSLGSAFGELARKLAEERTKKLLQQKQDTDAKKNDTPPKPEAAAPKDAKPPQP
jgi:flagellar biosynthesis GTPase FlhF